MVPTYSLALGARGNFKQAHSTVEADTLAEAIVLAQDEHPGMLVHHGWAVDQTIESTEDAEEKWMAEHRVPKNM